MSVFFPETISNLVEFKDPVIAANDLKPKPQTLIFSNAPQAWSISDIADFKERLDSAQTAEEFNTIYTEFLQDERTGVACAEAYDYLNEFDKKYQDEWVVVDINQVKVPGLSQEENYKHNVYTYYNWEYCQGEVMLEKIIKYSKTFYDDWTPEMLAKKHYKDATTEAWITPEDITCERGRYWLESWDKCVTYNTFFREFNKDYCEKYVHADLLAACKGD